MAPDSKSWRESLDLSSSQFLSVPPTLWSGTLNPVINILVESHGVRVRGKFPTDAEKTIICMKQVYTVCLKQDKPFPGPKA